MADLILGSEEVTPEVAKAIEGGDEPMTVAVVLDPAGEPAKVELTHNEAKRHHRVHEHMQARRQRKASQRALMEAKLAPHVPLSGVNLRDVGAVTRGPVRVGRVFRSSELLSKEEMTKHGIQTILDLRRMDRPCKKDASARATKVAESTKMVIKYLLLGPKKLVPEKRLLYVHRAHPSACTLCHQRACTRFLLDLQVIHADLIPSTVGLRIFQAMPAKVQAKALFMACMGKGAASVMAPAVANPLLLGYTALYRTLLEDSKRGMAMALRPFADGANYPVLVHCIHGKDRTGLIIMLLLMLCDVKPEAIVDDYVLSETVLKESRMHDELKLDVYLTSDDVIAATRDTMEQTITYVNEKYDSAAGYMHEIGLEDWEIANIRGNLKEPQEEDDVVSDSTPAPTKHKFGLSTLLPFSRRPSLARTQRAGLRRMSTPPSGSASVSDSTGQGHRASLPAEGEGVEQSQGSQTFGRASLAHSGPQEIRDMLRRLREDHPELGPLTEEVPTDFLRDSPPAAKLHSKAFSWPDASAMESLRSDKSGEGPTSEGSSPRKPSSLASRRSSDAVLVANGRPERQAEGQAAPAEKPAAASNAEAARLVATAEPPPVSPFAEGPEKKV